MVVRTSWDKYLEEQLKNPEIRRAFDEESRILNIGVALAQARKKRGLTQEQMARRMGTSGPQLSRTERRPGHATVRTLVRYADAVGMEVGFRLRRKRPRKHG